MKEIRLFGIPVIRINEEVRELNPENPSTPLGEWLKEVTDSNNGFSGSKESAMRFSAVYACVKIISETIASLPLSVLQSVNGEIKHDTHDLSYLIEKNPSESIKRFNFWETLLSHMLLTGNGYAIIKRDKSFRPVKLILVTNPERVEIKHDAMLDRLIYEIEEKSYKSIDILHLAGLSLDGIKGLNPIEYNRKVVSTGLNETSFQDTFFKNGAHVSGALSFPGALTDASYNRLRQSWESRNSGVGNTGKTAILEGGAKYEPIGIKPIDAQFMEQRRFTIEDIARIYRVPLHLLQDLSRSTNNNIEHQSIDFVQHTIRPIVKRIEAEIDNKLFTEEEKRTGRVFARFNLDALLRGDVVSRANYYNTLRYAGVLSANEIRTMEGWNKYTGGDDYLVQSNMIKINN